MLSQKEIHALMRTIEQAYQCRISIVAGHKIPQFTSNFPDFDTLHLAPVCKWVKKDYNGMCAVYDLQDVSKHAELVKGAFYKVCPFGCMDLVGTVNVPGMQSFQIFAGVFRERKDLPETALVYSKRFYTPFNAQDFRALSDEEFVKLPILMNMLTREIADLFIRQQKTKKEADPKEIVTSFINAHFRDNISLSDIAEKLGWSDSHTTVQIRRMFGKTFIQMLTERRLENVKWLLRNRTLYSISNIAVYSGFHNIPYFHRVFLRNVGVTPAEYRRNSTATP